MLTAAQKQSLLASVAALRSAVDALVPDAQPPAPPPPPPPPAPPPAPAAITLWPATAVPQTAAAADVSSVNLGVRFSADVDGLITGIRFYKGAGNSDTHIGALWSAAGVLLAQATFTGETASGWQQVNFAAPVAIKAGQVYVASYLAPVGRYAITNNQFASAGVTNGPLSAPQSGNGVYAYSASLAFPSQTWNASNYWVDVAFVAGAATAPPPPPPAPDPAPLKRALTWDASRGAVSYVIQWRTTSGVSGEKSVGNVLEYPFDSLGLSATTTYFMRVLALDAQGLRSPASNEIKVINGVTVP